jgi:threonine dehydrogenase-like Zn-dependent dehydrogenase
MRGAVLYGPRDVRFEERPSPTIVEPTDAVIRLSVTCICGSDLWPYRGITQQKVRRRWGTSTAASSKTSAARSSATSVQSG